MFVLIALMASSLIGASLLRTVLLSRQQLVKETQRTQAVLLAESGCARGLARLARQADYEGETWNVTAADLSGRDGAKVTIRLTSEEASPGRAIIATAEYPAGSTTAVRHTLRLSLSPPIKGAEP